MSAVSHKATVNNSPPIESAVLREARVIVRGFSMDAIKEGLAVASVDAEDSDETVRFYGRERLRALEEEFERRVRIISVPGSKAAEYNRDYEEWAQLASEVRERVTVPEVLALIGCHIRSSGTNRKTGETEFHSDCPACRDGVDRLVSWDGPNSRCWCRRCDFGPADTIAVTRSFVPGCQGFRDAVKFLSSLAALEQAVRR